MNDRPILKLVDKNWAQSSGRIVYDPVRPGLKSKTKRWVICTADREITRYFRWWVDKKILNPIDLPKKGLCQPSWDAHVSVIRGENDVRSVPKPMLEDLWGKYEGEVVNFRYSLNVKQSKRSEDGNSNNLFWFVEVQCPELTYIREEMGLPFDWPLHLTIGRLW